MKQKMPEQTKPKPKNPPSKPLPQWKVILHNDDLNDFADVCHKVCRMTPLKEKDVIQRVTEAHKEGVSLLLLTHKERAELYKEQFKSFLPPIVVTIEPNT